MTLSLCTNALLQLLMVTKYHIYKRPCISIARNYIHYAFIPFVFYRYKILVCFIPIFKNVCN